MLSSPFSLKCALSGVNIETPVVIDGYICEKAAIIAAINQHLPIINKLRLNPNKLVIDQFTTAILGYVNKQNTTQIQISELDTIYRCPISFEFPNMSALAIDDGYSYNLPHLFKHLQHSNLSPITRTPFNYQHFVMHPFGLRINEALRSIPSATRIDFAEVFHDYQQQNPSIVGLIINMPASDFRLNVIYGTLLTIILMGKGHLFIKSLLPTIFSHHFATGALLNMLYVASEFNRYLVPLVCYTQQLMQNRHNIYYDHNNQEQRLSIQQETLFNMISLPFVCLASLARAPWQNLGCSTANRLYSYTQHTDIWTSTTSNLLDIVSDYIILNLFYRSRYAWPDLKNSLYQLINPWTHIQHNNFQFQQVTKWLRDMTVVFLCLPFALSHEALYRQCYGKSINPILMVIALSMQAIMNALFLQFYYCALNPHSDIAQRLSISRSLSGTSKVNFAIAMVVTYLHNPYTAPYLLATSVITVLNNQAHQERISLASKIIVESTPENQRANFIDLPRYRAEAKSGIAPKLKLGFINKQPAPQRDTPQNYRTESYKL